MGNFQMTYEPFDQLIVGSEHPVILVEGTREVPEQDVAVLTAFGRWLAGKYPHARFRTGNAAGADTAFASGVAAVDPARLEYVTPYAGHRKELVASEAYQIPLSDISAGAEEGVVYQTSLASPAYDTLMASRSIPKLKAKAQYILRDTVKVMGLPEKSLLPATFGIFYVNRDDPMKGGTGHTIRVCQQRNVPVAFQDDWMRWPSSENACRETPPAHGIGPERTAL